MSDTAGFWGVAGTLLGTVVGAGLAWGKDWLFTRRERARHATYLAVRVTCILDEFIYGCDKFITYVGNEDLPIPTVPKPTLSLFPSDIDWKSIPTLLTYELLTFPNAIKVADESINFVGEVIAGPPDYTEFVEEKEYQYALLGLQAEKLANKLRASFAVPTRDDGERKPIERFCKSRDDVEAARRERQAAALPLFTDPVASASSPPFGPPSTS